LSVDHIACSKQEDDQKQKTTAGHCNVSHSIYTLPVFSCPHDSASATTDVAHSQIEMQVTGCAYDKTRYNVTTFTVNNVDADKQLICTVRFTAVQNQSFVFSEEQFVVLNGSNETKRKDRDVAKNETANNRAGKCIAGFSHCSLRIMKGIDPAYKWSHSNKSNTYAASRTWGLATGLTNGDYKNVIFDIRKICLHVFVSR